jgi:hypothetical protein
MNARERALATRARRIHRRTPRQLTLGNVLPSVAGLPGSSIKLLESEVPVRSVPPSHVPGAATRGLPAPHQLAH